MRKGSAPELSGAASDHRRRLLAAMVEAASRHGYPGSTVSRVVELAGVSRATFYEHFPSKDECFLAAYRSKIGRVKAAIGMAPGASEPEDLPAALLNVLLDQLATDPGGARLVLVEAFAAPPAIRAEHEHFLKEIDAVMSSYLDRQEPGGLQVPARSLLAGLGQTLTKRALSDATVDLSRLRDDLLRWIDSYRMPGETRALPQRHWSDLGRFSAAVPSSSTDPALLPRGPTSLPQQQAAKKRRERILDATARIAAADGYASLTVARISASARVPRTAFYSHFDSKIEALLATQTYATQGAIAVAAAEYLPGAPWPDRVRRAMDAFLHHLAEKADYAHLDLVESFLAGPVAIRHRLENQMVFSLFLEDGYRQTPRSSTLPRICSEAIAGAIFGLMRKLVVEGKVERMPSLLPAAVYTILAPFIGPQEAAEQAQGS